jgi:hypothetical protein
MSKLCSSSDQDRMSNHSKISQGSVVLSATNRRAALNRKINPILKPIDSKKPDLNSSKHSFSANNSVNSEQGAEDVTFEEFEQLLSTTQSNINELTKEFKGLSSALGQSTPAPAFRPVGLPKPDSGKGPRTAANLDSLLSSTAINPIPRANSKIGFSIKSGRQQRSLSRNKK